MTARVAAAGVHWKADPLYATQVNYARQTPCLLETHPEIGPDEVIAPGGSFESFRTFELLHDSTERERRGLALRRMYRTLAPWAHREPGPDARPQRGPGGGAARRRPGRGRRLRDGHPHLRQRLRHGERGSRRTSRGRELVDYAHGKGIELGAYSLLGSRRIDDANDVINPKTGKPGGAIFGSTRRASAAAGGRSTSASSGGSSSDTGLDLIEHDGSYPGDVCASTEHPGHRGLDDSQWTQWSDRATSTRGAARAGSTSTCPTGTSCTARTRPAWVTARTTGRCPATGRSSSAGRTSSTAPGRRRRRWAGCSCR